jgi:tRNA-Thr(GGU) m(6)t(6)A37 methyltransferase TsaA
VSQRIISVGTLALLGLALSTSEAQKGTSAEEPFRVSPVGWIHHRDHGVTIEIAPRYADALLGLDGFSHVWVIWWFDRNDNPRKRSVLRVHPRGNPKNPLTGVFATRSPARPNLVGMTLCRIVSLEGSTLRVERIDAFDGTPVLDLKPYIPGSDGVPKARVPSWVGED